MKIRKALDLALGPDTPEAEANHAMQNAQRLMSKYNLDQARVMVETTPADGEKDARKLARGNLYWTRVRTEKGKPPQFWRWMVDVSSIIARSFGCKTCNNAHDIRFSFYGVAESAQAAAHAFVKYSVYMSQKMSLYEPPGADRRSGLARATYVRSQRIAFCNGMVSGLRSAFAEDRRAEQRRRKRLREFLDLYDKMEREHAGDELYEDILDEMARELGIDRGNRREAELQVATYEMALVCADDTAKETLDRLGMRLGKAKQRNVSGSSSSAYLEGVREGKRMRRALEDKDLPLMVTDSEYN